MPFALDGPDEMAGAAQQITLTSSDADYIDQLVPVLKDLRSSDRAAQLMHSLDQLSADREAEIERMCNSNHQEFVNSVNQLLSVREGTVNLTSEILSLSQSIQASTERLVKQKRALVDSRGVRQNIDEVNKAINACLEVLRLANQIYDLLAKYKYYPALRALDELRSVHLREVGRYKIAEMIEKSVPETQKLIAKSVMDDLNTWLFRIREVTGHLGEVAFTQTSDRRERMKERVEQEEDDESDRDKVFSRFNFKLNSPVELALDETEEFDVLNNDVLDIDIEFHPLLECLHIHETLGQGAKFRAEYGATRRQQRDLTIPADLDLVGDENYWLSQLLENVAGFAILEKVIMNKTENFRSPADVEEIWESMCKGATALITKNLPAVDDDRELLRIKGRLGLFIQTMETWEFSTASLEPLILTIFEKYAQLLRNRFSDDFQEIVSTDDYMPMAIHTPEELEKVVSNGWFKTETDLVNLSLPTVFPFSQMYALCCIDIRNFLNAIYLFSDDLLQRSSVIDDTLKTSLDELLCDQVCQLLLDRLSSQYPGQIVQILTNFEYFEIACVELQTFLFEARSSTSASGPVVLNATERFREGRKTAEKRIFELVNSKIDDLIETAEYDWLALTPLADPSTYMQELTRYLSANMSSVLLGLPPEIKELVYFDALSHASTSLLSLPLHPSVKKISPAAVATLAADVAFLSDFVDELGNPILKENLDELVQTVALMGAENGDEFFDVASRNRKYGRVDNLNGATLLEKVGEGRDIGGGGVQSPVKTDRFASIRAGFGMNK
ncbi:exocyst complex subunit Sec15-like protein [Aulographum hederae CBS 113979]|uniref:Exocyst complex component SEC15 n=1 Tax=Aulographum hederae CBS 113979 TaxID=1176131 RepID=A0A6G1GYU0_9PEZI|nr:exocyst complex subunit Sec15-like protein [Aulographum hederae CBS 113979]